MTNAPKTKLRIIPSSDCIHLILTMPYNRHLLAQRCILRLEHNAQEQTTCSEMSMIYSLRLNKTFGISNCHLFFYFTISNLMNKNNRL